jgi:hypothetical protein
MGERWTIIPEFDIDFVDSEEKYVYGIAFGYEF